MPSLLPIAQKITRITFGTLFNEVGELDMFGPEEDPDWIFPEGGHVVVCQGRGVGRCAGGDFPGCHGWGLILKLSRRF